MHEFVEALIRLNHATNNLLKPPTSNALDAVVVHPMVIRHILESYIISNKDVKVDGGSIRRVTYMGVDFVPSKMHYSLQSAKY